MSRLGHLSVRRLTGKHEGRQVLHPSRCCDGFLISRTAYLVSALCHSRRFAISLISGEVQPVGKEAEVSFGFPNKGKALAAKFSGSEN